MAYSPYAPYSNGYNGFPVGYPGAYQQQYVQPVYPAPPQYAQPAPQPVGQAGTQQTQQQTQQNAVQQPVATQPPVQDNRLYVQGEAGAMAYLVPRGMVVILWDSTRPFIYIKSTDNATGRPYFLDILEYTSHMQPQQQNADTDKTDNVTYITAKELEDRLEEVRAEYKPLLPLLNGDGKKGKTRLAKESDSENA